MSKLIDLTGKRFGRLTVVGRAYTEDKRFTYWLCDCDCGTKCKIVLGMKLRNGTTKSCGCLTKERATTELVKINKKYNTYDLSGEYGIGYTRKGEEFYFDLEDYDKIKDYCWRIDREGYVVTNINRIPHKFHRIILGIDEDFLVDHINGVKHNNRKINLRVCNTLENSRNRKVNKNNKTGISGVTLSSNNKYVARIGVCNKLINLGTYNKIEDAIYARLKAEKEYYGEFAHQKHLFEQYGI